MPLGCRNKERLVKGPLRNRSLKRLVALALLLSGWLLPIEVQRASAQGTSLPSEMEYGGMDSPVPMSYQGAGSFFSQELGTPFRILYHTQAYGQDDTGNLDIGTMKVFSFDDSTAFVDGQVTLSDVQGVGYNIGAGYRWLTETEFGIDPQRISGVSVWADGTSTRADNFFPQIGFSLESLGDIWDARFNSYLPIGNRNQIGGFTSTGEVSFSGNSLVDLLVGVQDDAYFVNELEVARRLDPGLDAWAFGGSYALTGGPQDSLGYRAGFRGYAHPDVMVQVAVSDDDVFHTTATFSLTWFVGRTRSNYCPTGTLVDRFREPVLRNDYVTLSQQTVFTGTPFTDTNGDAFRIVHVDSDAPDGGDGTFENPLNNLDDIEANSQEDDIVLAWSESVFDGQGAVLQDNQRFLGEGDDMVFTVTTSEEGPVEIPETSPGARALARPIISDSADAVTLALGNEVANFEFEGGVNGIVSPTGGAGNPNLHDLEFRNLSGTGISFRPMSIIDTEDLDGDLDIDEILIPGNVTINNVVFMDMGGTEIDIDSATTEDLTDPNVSLFETIAISNVTSTEGSGIGILLQNTHDNRTATITNYRNGILSIADSGGGTSANGVLRFAGTNAGDFQGNLTLTNVDVFNNVGYAFDFQNIGEEASVTLTGGSSYDGGAGDAGGMRFENFDGAITASNTTFENGLRQGLSFGGANGGVFTFNNTVTFESIGGTVIDVGADVGDSFTGSLTVNGNIIENTTGRAVSIQRVTDDGAVLTFGGEINHNTSGADSEGVFIANNTAGTFRFTGAMELTTDGSNSFEATGGGIVSATNTTNELDATGATALHIEDMEIGTGGVIVASLNATSGEHGIELRNNEGAGQVVVGTIGDDPGDAGTIMNTTGNAIVIEDTPNVTITGLIITNTNVVSGVEVDLSGTEDMIVNLNDLQIDDGNIGVEVTGTGGTGDLTMSINDTDVNDSTAFGLSFIDVDNGTVQVNNVTVDGDPANGAAVGVLIQDSDATFTFDADTLIQEFASMDFVVNGGDTNITMRGDINNTDAAGRSVYIHNVTGGTVNFASTALINDANSGMLIENNTGGTFTFLGTNDFNTDANIDAVVLTNNDGATISFSDLDIVATGTGRGFVATGGGTLSMTGTSNQIDSSNGTGLEISDMTIGSVDLLHVTVNGGGATNGIVLTNLEGGQVAIGAASGAQNSGGQLTTTGDAIVLTNVQNVDLRHIRIVDSTAGNGISVTHTNAATTSMDVTITDLNLDDAAVNGITVSADNDDDTFSMRLLNSDLERNVLVDVTGEGQFNMFVDSTIIDIGTADDAFTLAFSGDASSGDVTFSDNAFTAGAGQALLVSSADSDSKSIRLLIEDSTFITTSTDPAAEISISGNTLMQATIQGNTFEAAGTYALEVVSNGTATSRMRLNLGGDESDEFNSAAGGAMLVDENGTSDFRIFEVTDTITNDTRNFDPVDSDPNDAAFLNLATPPALPNFP